MARPALRSIRFKYYQRRTYGSVRIIIMNIDVRPDHTIWRHPGVDQPSLFCIWGMQSIMCDTFVGSMTRIRRLQLMESVLVFYMSYEGRHLIRVLDGRTDHYTPSTALHECEVSYTA